MENPTKISARQEKNIKKYVKDYFDKAVAKKKEHDKKRAERKKHDPTMIDSPATQVEREVKKEEHSEDDDELMVMSDNEGNIDARSQSPSTPTHQIVNGEGLKRKREIEDGISKVDGENAEVTPRKRFRSITPPAPPPPPPPPVTAATSDELVEETGNELDTAHADPELSPIRNGKAYKVEENLADIHPEEFSETNDKLPEPHWKLNGGVEDTPDEIDDGVSEDGDNCLKEYRNHRRQFVEAQRGP